MESTQLAKDYKKLTKTQAFSKSDAYAEKTAKSYEIINRKKSIPAKDFNDILERDFEKNKTTGGGISYLAKYNKYKSKNENFTRDG